MLIVKYHVLELYSVRMQRNPLVIHIQSVLRAHAFCRRSLQKSLGD